MKLLVSKQASEKIIPASSKNLQKSCNFPITNLIIVPDIDIGIIDFWQTFQHHQNIGTNGSELEIKEPYSAGHVQKMSRKSNSPNSCFSIFVFAQKTFKVITSIQNTFILYKSSYSNVDLNI